MAENNETKNAEVKETGKKETGKKTEKKVATGSTKKMVQKRSSSVAGKAASKKENEAKTTKTNNKAKSISTTKKDDTSRKDRAAKTTTKAKTASKSTGTKTRTTKKKVEDKKEKIKEVNTTLENEEIEKIETVKNEDQKVKSTIKENKNTKNGKDNKSSKNTKQINKKIQERKETELEQAVGEEIKKNKKLPNEVFNKINSRVFQDVILAVAIMVYLNFIALGFANVGTSIFITDLKVFSVVLLFVSIGIFEYAYKKDSGRYALLGIEVLMLAFTTVGFIYVDLMLSDKFTGIAAILVYVFAIYYVGKAIIIYNKMKKEYFVNEMKKIIKK